MSCHFNLDRLCFAEIFAILFFCLLRFSVQAGFIYWLHYNFKIVYLEWKPLREKCPYSELFWSGFSRLWTEYGKMLCISPYLVRIREKGDQNNSEHGLFLRSELQFGLFKPWWNSTWVYRDEIVAYNRNSILHCFREMNSPGL